MASESFVPVINIHGAAVNLIGGRLFCILQQRPVTQSLTKSALVLLRRFSPLLLLHLLYFPAVRTFFVGIHLLCCHGAAEESEREEEE